MQISYSSCFPPTPRSFLICFIPSLWSNNCSRDWGLSLEQQGLLDHSIWAWNLCSEEPKTCDSWSSFHPNSRAVVPEKNQCHNKYLLNEWTHNTLRFVFIIKLFFFHYFTCVKYSLAFPIYLQWMLWNKALNFTYCNLTLNTGERNVFQIQEFTPPIFLYWCNFWNISRNLVKASHQICKLQRF